MNPVGCCINGASFVPQVKDSNNSNSFVNMYEGFKAIKNAGLDFAEIGVRMANDITQEDKDILRSENMKFAAANSLIPLPVIDTEWNVIKDYIEKTMKNLSDVGCEIVVFGSGGARSIPEGLTEIQKQSAVQRLHSFMRLCGDNARENGMMLAIEPLNYKETNYINTVADGFRAVEAVDHPAVRLLCDTYHMAVNGEDPHEAAKYSDAVIHVHTAELEGRFFPGRNYRGQGDENDYIFKTCSLLKEKGYAGRFSCEGKYENFEKDVFTAAGYMKKYLR